MSPQRFDRSHGQRRREAEGHRSGIPHFQRRDVQHVRQTLPTELLGRGQAIPAASDPVAVELLPAIGKNHLAIRQPCALLVAILGKRLHLLAGETPGFRQDGIDKVGAEIAENALFHGALHASDMFQGERDFFDRRLVHDDFLRIDTGDGPPHPEPSTICGYS